MSNTDEIIRVVKAGAPRTLTATEIWDQGEFDCKQVSVCAMLSQLAQPSGPLCREKVDGVYQYGIRPGGAKQGRTVRPMDGDKIDPPQKETGKRRVPMDVVLEALGRHTDLDGIAYATGYAKPLVRQMLNDLERVGLARKLPNDCWGYGPNYEDDKKPGPKRVITVDLEQPPAVSIKPEAVRRVDPDDPICQMLAYLKSQRASLDARRLAIDEAIAAVEKVQGAA